jgi:site-specific DNA-methyltransferase (adenine-specific)
MTEDNLHTKVDLENGSPAFAKPVLYAGAVEKARISIYNEDCLQALKAMADKQFDLAIVDPPYGIGMDGTIGIGIGKEKGFTRKKEYTKKNWDKEVPSQEYFDELFRVSKNQIVWGANYFTKQLPIIKNYIFWHKKGQSVDDKFNDGEMAFASLGRTRMVDIWWNGVGVINSGENKIHPTQKPVKLYKWLLENYAKKDWKILDTHLGSGSIAIACWDMGYDLTAYEVDKEYYDNACKRLETHKAQLTLW